MTTCPQKIFEFSIENKIKAESCLTHYPKNHQQSALIFLLELAQIQNDGWLSHSAIETVANLVNIPFIKAFEVASFYSLFNLNPTGKYHIQLCRTTPCWLKGSDEIYQTCVEHLGIKAGETTPDDLFTLSEVECLGACIKAPIVQINKEIHENLTSESLIEILKRLAAQSKDPRTC